MKNDSLMQHAELPPQRIVSDDVMIRSKDHDNEVVLPSDTFDFFSNQTTRASAPYPIHDVGLSHSRYPHETPPPSVSESRVRSSSGSEEVLRNRQSRGSLLGESSQVGSIAITNTDTYRAPYNYSSPRPVMAEGAPGLYAHSVTSTDLNEYHPVPLQNTLRVASGNTSLNISSSYTLATEGNFIAPPHGGQFSFSEADDSVIEVSPVRDNFEANELEDNFETNEEFVNPLLPQSSLRASASRHSSLPQKSVSNSLNSNVIGQIIGNYDYSTSLLMLGRLRTEDAKAGLQQSLTSVATTKSNPQEREFNLQELVHGVSRPPLNNHNRNNSESSTTSVTSTTSTLTNSKPNGQQRFLRYAMSTQTVPSLKSLNRWLMGNVLAWLDYHGFNESWKETFRRNEISGNRFLELANYESSSAVWKQFSHSLGVNGHNSVVDRFLTLLKSELEELDQVSPSSGALPELDPVVKAENRKSSSTLWTPSTAAPNMKPRPFSYIDPSNLKVNAKEPSHSHKFFRKHHRNSSSDSGKYSPVSASSGTGTKSSEAVPSSATSAGSRKSGIFSTLRKYGGDKAVGIVKQVQSNTGSSISKASGHRKSVHGLSSITPKKSDPTPKPFQHKVEPQTIPKPVEEHTNSPKSAKSLHALPDEVVPSPIESSYLSSPFTNNESGKTPGLDQKYLPSIKSGEPVHQRLVMVTKDNSSFTPTALEAHELADVSALKRKFFRALDMLDFGIVTFHLTDFNANPGEAMSDEVLLLAVQQDFFVKIKVTQTINSSFGTGTFSSTSSDSKSFDTSGDNNGKMYPATPQYMLQDPRDKSVDYLNFKDQDLLKKIAVTHATRAEANQVPREKMAEFLPLKLSMPNSKRVPTQGANSKQRALPPLDTTPLLNVSEPPRPVVDNGGSFSVLRKEGKEIDFNKRKQVSTDSKAPRLIPNIYSSSVTDSAVSPISATTIRALKDETSGSLATKSGLNLLQTDSTSLNSSPASDIDKSGSFVAKRKAPPPPSKANSLSVSHKISTSSLRALPAPSVRSDASFLGDSNLSFRLSKDTKLRVLSKSSTFSENKIDFGNAPDFVLPPESSANASISDDDDDDGFFVKPLKIRNKPNTASESTPPKAIDDDDEEDEFFVKKLPKSSLNKMNVRPPVEELYNNLEKYFPNTNLDKPIIDATADITPVSSKPSNPASRKVSISRTFSNANISPINAPLEGREDEIFYGDGPKLTRRMKTIRIVANEARIKRLASLRAADGGYANVSRRENSATPVSLVRTNTKLWGQKVREVTSAEIEKGFVSRMRNSTGGYEEFAWIKGELIGRGSFGSVFLALNVTTGEMLAVKQVIVHGNAASNSEGLEALHKEVETMKYLDHLNIVQYLGFEQKENTYSLFLEYVAGGSISSCLKSYGKFDEPLVRFITRQVLEGLKYLHSNGILHRDLKADNLLLEIDGTCKISDFGISKKSQDIYSNNAEMSMQGTIFWMAPEVIHNMVEDKKQGYSAKIDIWSLGCVVLEMFAGQRPWSNEAVVSAIYKIGKTKLAPPIPEELGNEAKDFLNNCFTPDAEKRPTAEVLLRHPFMNIDPRFQFSGTKLGQTIKFNSRKSMRPN